MRDGTDTQVTKCTHLPTHLRSVANFSISQRGLPEFAVFGVFAPYAMGPAEATRVN